MSLSLNSFVQQRGCSMCRTAVVRISSSTPMPTNTRFLGRRWFCQTAMYCFQLIPGGTAVDLPRPLTDMTPWKGVMRHTGRTQDGAGINLGEGRWKDNFPRTFTTTAGTAASISTNATDFPSKKESTTVLFALEQLVSRLDYAWEPTLAAPQKTEGEEARFARPKTIPTTLSAPSSKSIEEYVRIICAGYDKLPPLQLGWIATNSVATSPPSLPKNHLYDWECPRSAILYFLAQQCGLPDTNNNRNDSPAWNNWIQDLVQRDNTGNHACLALSPTVAVLQELQRAWTPRYENVIQCLLEHNSQQTVAMLVPLRGDLLRLMKVLPKGSMDAAPTNLDVRCLQPLEHHLRRLLATWFSPGMLEIQRITFNTTSAGIIEKIAVKEAVHPMKSLDDLRRRLGPKRRVFALFHPLLPEEPLVILHVHLESNADTIPATMSHVLTEEDGNSNDGEVSESRTTLTPRTATFYSISNTQPGLTRGLGLGEFLIKNAVQLLQKEFPTSLHTFVTLSPLPGFRKWIEGLLVLDGDSEKVMSHIEWVEHLSQTGALSQDMVDTLSSTKTSRNQLYQLLRLTKKTETTTMDDEQLQPSITEQLKELKPLLTKLAANYLVLAKNLRSGKPLDPVAGFHIHNGAEVHRVNFAADLSRKGLLRSFGVMTNYRYMLEHIDRNKASYETSQYSQIALSANVRELLAGNEVKQV